MLPPELTMAMTSLSGCTRREGERERERERERETERQRDRETERQRDRGTEGQRDSERERVRERERERETDRQRDRETERQRDSEREKERKRRRRERQERWIARTRRPRGGDDEKLMVLLNEALNRLYSSVFIDEDSSQPAKTPDLKSEPGLGFRVYGF